MRTINHLKTILIVIGIISLTACCTNKQPMQPIQPVAAATMPATQSYYFDFDKNNVRPKYSVALQKQGQYLAEHPNARVEVVGNADERGSNQYNYHLAMRRAEAIAKLLEKNGASSDQIRVISKGEDDPIAIGTSAAAYQKNRRADMTFTS